MKTIRPKFAMNSLLVAVCLALFAAACAAAYAQTQSSPKPISLKGLEDAIKIGGLKDSELIGQIQSRGVDFTLTSKMTDALRGLGVFGSRHPGRRSELSRHESIGKRACESHSALRACAATARAATCDRNAPLSGPSGALWGHGGF